jgi:hypothetical protein
MMALALQHVRCCNQRHADQIVASLLLRINQLPGQAMQPEFDFMS